jgi:putative ABC transport system permease protein
MFHLSRQTVRQNWTLYAGAFVALAFGVLMLGLAATTTAATAAYQNGAPGGILVTVTGDGEAPRQVRYGGEDVSGLQSVLGIIAMISGFITIFVVASTFAFVVASRRRELGLLRLIGATPRQVRRMVLGEALCVAFAASLAGAIAAQLLTPLVLDQASGTELAPVRLSPASPWLPLGVTIAIGMLVALLGARAASKRAAKVAPVEALREATVEPRRLGWGRALVGTLFLAGAIAMLALIRPGTGEAVVALAMFTPMVLVIALVALAPVLIPLLARLWGLLMSRTTSGHLARANVVAGPRRTASLASPILGISAIAGSMVLSLSFAADASYAAMQRDIVAPIVVPGNGKDPSGIRGVEVADGAIPVEVIRTDRGDADGDTALGVDPASYARTHRITVSLAELRGDTVAISKELSMFDGYRVGDEMGVTFLDGTAKKLRVVAVLDISVDILPGLLLPRELAQAHAPDAVPDEWFVIPSPGASPDIPGAVPTAEWIKQTNDEMRDGLRFGLILMLGPGALYAGIAIANTLLMGVLQRRHEFATTRLLGVTPSQIRRMVLAESGLVGLIALSLGTGITVLVGGLIRWAMTSGLPSAPVTVPWPVLGGIAAVCLVIAVGAALAPTAYILRTVRPADAG